MLYFLKEMSGGMNKKQAAMVINFCIGVLEMDEGIEDKEFDFHAEKAILRGIKENQLRRHFLVFCHNPIKI